MLTQAATYSTAAIKGRNLHHGNVVSLGDRLQIADDISTRYNQKSSSKACAALYCNPHTPWIHLEGMGSGFVQSTDDWRL
jgi:hypothetical protein